jgi:hypothetical protein
MKDFIWSCNPGRIKSNQIKSNSSIFLPKRSETGKNLHQPGIFVPFEEMIFCLFRREKYSCYCRGNFFLAGGCSISPKARSRTGAGTFLQCRGATYRKIRPIFEKKN